MQGRPEATPMPSLDLCIVVTDRPAPTPGALAVAKAAVAGGASLIQLRVKERSTRDFVGIALQLKELLADKRVPLIINDRMDVALAVGAAGVHLGQDDLSVREARRVWPSGIIGASVSDRTEAVAAQTEGASYLGAGPVYPTKSKDDAGKALGIKTLGTITTKVDIPVVAIGGIGVENVAAVMAGGTAGIAVISAVADAADMEEATRQLKRSVLAAKAELGSRVSAS